MQQLLTETNCLHFKHHFLSLNTISFFLLGYVRQRAMKKYLEEPSAFQIITDNFEVISTWKTEKYLSVKRKKDLLWKIEKNYLVFAEWIYKVFKCISLHISPWINGSIHKIEFALISTDIYCDLEVKIMWIKWLTILVLNKGMYHTLIMKICLPTPTKFGCMPESPCLLTKFCLHLTLFCYS